MSHRSGDASPYRLDPTLEFMQLLWTIEHALQKRSKRMKREIGMTGPQRLVVRVVAQFPGISAGDLARLLKLHPSTITGIVQRLVAARLLRRARHPADTRRMQLWTTPRAERRVRRASPTVEHTVRAVLRQSAGSQITGARAVLAQLAQRLSE